MWCRLVRTTPLMVRSHPNLRLVKRVQRQPCVHNTTTSSHQIVVSCSAGWRRWLPQCSTTCGRVSHEKLFRSCERVSSRCGSLPTLWPTSYTSLTSGSRREPGTLNAALSSMTCVVWRCVMSTRVVSCWTSCVCCRSTSSSCASEFTRCCVRRAFWRPIDCSGLFTWSRLAPSFPTFGASLTCVTYSFSAATGSPPSTFLSQWPAGSAATGAIRRQSTTTLALRRSTSALFTGRRWPWRRSEICRHRKPTGSECCPKTTKSSSPSSSSLLLLS